MKVGFNDDSFAFEFVRNLGFMYYGGCDLGEMMATASTIVEGDFESWCRGWSERADKLLGRAVGNREAGHDVSARDAYLHASTYFRMAEFYLHGNPNDPRILSLSRASQDAYRRAAAMFGPTWERIEIPYEGTMLPGYFYKVDDDGAARPTVIFHGGFDSSVEELFYYGAAAAVRRGYNCLTFDGPGQGSPLREQKLPFRHDWEKVVSPVVDYAVGRADVDGSRLALMGMSLGGYLAARAAAFEHRFGAVVLFGGVEDYYDGGKNVFPAEAIAAFEAGDVSACERAISDEMATNTNLRWYVTQGIYAFGASGAADFIERTKKMTMKGLAGRISAPTLVLEAENDLFFKGQPERIFGEIAAPKAYFSFSSEDGAENHCQSGALSYKDEIVFNWIDDALRPARKDVG